MHPVRAPLAFSQVEPGAAARARAGIQRERGPGAAVRSARDVRASAPRLACARRSEGRAGPSIQRAGAGVHRASGAHLPGAACASARSSVAVVSSEGRAQLPERAGAGARAGINRARAQSEASGAQLRDGASEGRASRPGRAYWMKRGPRASLA